jgi:drug/metabolite transporter (DMT)-like permease
VSGQAATTPADNPPLAATFLVSALFILGFQDALVKITSSEVSLWQMQTIRATGNIVLLLLLSRFLFGRARPIPRSIGAVVLRTVFLVGTMILFFGGIPFLTLAEIAAGLYVFPLFIAVLSALLLGEPVGPRRVAAILLGFCGTLLILKPGTDSFTWISLMPVGAGLCYAAMILTTRRLCREEHPVTLAFGTGIGFILVGIVGLFTMTVFENRDLAQRWPYLMTGWRPLELWVFGIIVATSFLNLTANLSLARAYQTAEASWLAPFDYSYLIFATFWGYAIWGHVPDVYAISGMVLIAASGSYVAWRERQLAGQ